MLKIISRFLTVDLLLHIYVMVVTRLNFVSAASFSNITC